MPSRSSQLVQGAERQVEALQLVQGAERQVEALQLVLGAERQVEEFAAVCKVEALGRAPGALLVVWRRRRRMTLV